MTEVSRELFDQIKKRLGERMRKKFLSPTNWREYWKTQEISTSPPSWVYGREIRIFRTPAVDIKVVPYVKAGIEDLINQIELNFVVRDYGDHPSAVAEVNQSLLADSSVDGSKLAEILANESWRKPELGGKPHADAVIFDRFLYKVNDRDWGRSEYSKGYLLLALPKARQNSHEFIRKISKHEASHLFGFQYHHDNWANKVKMKEGEIWIPKINGYTPVRDCNTLWQASTPYTCEMCADAIKYIWLGLQDRTGTRFIK